MSLIFIIFSDNVGLHKNVKDQNDFSNVQCSMIKKIPTWRREELLVNINQIIKLRSFVCFLLMKKDLYNYYTYEI